MMVFDAMSRDEVGFVLFTGQPTLELSARLAQP